MKLTKDFIIKSIAVLLLLGLCFLIGKTFVTETAEYQGLEEYSKGLSRISNHRITTIGVWGKKAGNIDAVYEGLLEQCYIFDLCGNKNHLWCNYLSDEECEIIKEKYYKAKELAEIHVFGGTLSEEDSEWFSTFINIVHASVEDMHSSFRPMADFFKSLE